jgi:sulfoxide reductase heme-binding subunit YedZ
LVWLKLNWRWSALNLFAGCVSAYVLSQGSTGWSNMGTFDSGLESGKWAIRFLLACLTMTPLNTYFGWKSGIKLRKSAGLWAFAFASLHVLLYIRDAKLEWLTFSMPLFLTLGLAGMSILSVLTSTSNRWAMQRLGKNWKRLHRLVYILGITVVTHSMLATMMSKKIFVRDPQAANELKAYVAILSVLLVVRIPLVRQFLKQIPVLLKRRGRLVSSVAIPGDQVELWPKIHGSESRASLKPTFIIPNEISEHCESSNIGNPPQELKRISNGREAVRSTEILPEREV